MLPVTRAARSFTPVGVWVLRRAPFTQSGKQGEPRQMEEHILDPDPGLNPAELLVPDWAVIVIKSSKRASVSLIFQGLYQHFSEEQVVELILRITLCEFFNKFNDALQIEIEPDAIEEMLSLDKAS